MGHIKKLMKHHGTTGYYYKDRSDLIGFHDGGGMAWYRWDWGANNAPVKVDRGTPEQEFDRLQHARFNRLTSGMLRDDDVGVLQDDVVTALKKAAELKTALAREIERLKGKEWAGEDQSRELKELLKQTGEIETELRSYKKKNLTTSGSCGILMT